ncbi:MAG: hypothetical protein ACM3QS_08285 [Bacteroidota bacterium]
MLSRLQQFFQVPGAPAGWFRETVLFPFIITRFIWILVGYFAFGNYATNPSYQKYYERGFFLSKYFILDMFSRWDARWYLSIITEGYKAAPDLTEHYSNLAFFPLYPYLVKSLGWLGLDLPNAYYLLVGLVLSNLLFIAAMALLYRMITVEMALPPQAGARALGLIFVFPAGFFFASFYTESLFLFLAVAAFTCAYRENWLATGVLAALGVLTRSQGTGLLLALGWFYMEKRAWHWREIRASAGWFVLAPMALLGHFYYLYLKSGRPLAIFDAMSAWGRISVYNVADPFRNLQGPALDVFKIDLVLFAIFLLCSVYILWKWPLKAHGVFALLMCLLPAYTGLLVSMSRYLAVVFPVFILAGEKLENRNAYLAIAATFFALQVVYFAGWVNYYWIA